LFGSTKSTMTYVPLIVTSGIAILPGTSIAVTLTSSDTDPAPYIFLAITVK